MVINLILTSLELVKSFKMFELSGLYRRTIYYINSSFSSRFILKSNFKSYNIHLGNTNNIIKFAKLHLSTFYLSNWPYGFLSNRKSFALYASRLHRSKMLKYFYKEKYFFDFFPRRASGGVLTNTNLKILKEFIVKGVPFISLGDVFIPSTQSDWHFINYQVIHVHSIVVIFLLLLL